MSGIEPALAALYLRGLPRPVEPHVRAWPAVLSILRRAAVVGPADTADALRGAGFSTEAASLNGKAWEHAARLLESELAITAASSYYPRGWVEKLGAAAPPAIYIRGEPGLLLEPTLAVVGSRRPPARSFRAATEAVLAATGSGRVVVSGGAPGIDRAVGASDAFIEVWPCGLGVRWGARRSADCRTLHVSLWPPREVFSTAGAMERNTLIYALAEAAYVGHARFKKGGSWHGATEALRRRLGRVLVSAEPWPRADEPARRALIGLGAVLLEGGEAGLARALEAEPLQPWLPVFPSEATAQRALSTF
ncbi:MAG TPA: DNA-processing protein DprA [Fimbriimonadaceae bacterium]|nr:DNA-processing protein DprA [Fimbriimonadaceae bacterium]